MPLTPLHYPIAYIQYRLEKRLNFPALIVGNFFPDLSIPVLYFLAGSRTYGRFTMHSLFGAVTFGTPLAVGFTVLIYPRLISYLQRLCFPAYLETSPTLFLTSQTTNTIPFSGPFYQPTPPLILFVPCWAATTLQV